MSKNEEEIELGDDEDDVSGEESSPTDGGAGELSAAEVRRRAAADKLRAVRARLSDARRRNDEGVMDENKRKHETPQQAAKRQRRERWEKQQQLLKEDGRVGAVDAETLKHLNMSVAAAAAKAPKKKKEHFDWNMYNDDAQGRNYDRRVKASGIAKRSAESSAYEKQKDSLGDDEFYEQTASLNYGSLSSKVSDASATRLVNEMQRQTKRRGEWSRHRPEYVDADVDYINERNRKFNKKLSRAFDKFTTEIRGNLERGTAL